jgi:Interferon-induced transmembrane protein
MIPNHLVEATLVTLCCCLPLGIPAIVYGAQVRPKVEAGDVQGALEASRKAKMWSWIGFGVGAAGVLLYVLAIVVGVLAER